MYIYTCKVLFNVNVGIQSKKPYISSFNFPYIRMMSIYEHNITVNYPNVKQTREIVDNTQDGFSQATIYRNTIII